MGKKYIVGKGENTIKPFPNKALSLLVCSTSLLKTQWKKEDMFVTSNFSFSHSVVYAFRD